VRRRLQRLYRPRARRGLRGSGACARDRVSRSPINAPRRSPHPRRARSSSRARPSQADRLGGVPPMHSARELRVSKVDCVRESRSAGSCGDSLPRCAPRRTARGFGKGAWRVVPHAVALGVALVSGSAIARGGGHGGGGHSCGGHHSVGGRRSVQSVAMRGCGSSSGSSPALTNTLYGWPEAYTTVVDTARAEPWRRVIEAPHDAADVYAGVIAAPPQEAASPADIYTYTDARGVIHFTNYRPTDGQAQVYLRTRSL
jgi:hypothetical protein